jgi:hypothetical protein
VSRREYDSPLVRFLFRLVALPLMWIARGGLCASEALMRMSERLYRFRRRENESLAPESNGDQSMRDR